MDIQTYVKGAVETESKLAKIEGNLPISAVLHFGVVAGELVDMMKKHVFYKRELNVEQWNKWVDQLDHWTKVLRLSTEIKHATVSFDTNTRLFHAAVGIFTEGGELLEALIKNGKDIDVVNFKEELGDTEWYQAIAYDEIQVNPEDNFQNNYDKLAVVRFKNKGFSNDAANNRDLKSERNVLELKSGKNKQSH